jgi:hypothetical protein
MKNKLTKYEMNFPDRKFISALKKVFKNNRIIIEKTRIKIILNSGWLIVYKRKKYHKKI